MGEWGVALLASCAVVVCVLVVGVLLRGRLRAWFRREVRQVAGPAIVRAMPPREVLQSVFPEIYGPETRYEDVVTALLGGPGNRVGGGDTAVSRRTSAHFQITTVNSTDCVTRMTTTHEYTGVRNNHRFVIFATSDRTLAGLIAMERVFPLFELWIMDEDALEDFVPQLRESMHIGLTYLDRDGNYHEVDLRRHDGTEVPLRSFDHYVRLPENVDRKNIRIVQIDLHDLADDHHVVEAVETMSVQMSSVARFDLGYVIWSAPHPCFVSSVTFDVSQLARPGDDLVYLVVLATIKQAGLPVSTWAPMPSVVEVPVESWMLPGHNVALLYRAQNAVGS